MKYSFFTILLCSLLLGIVACEPNNPCSKLDCGAHGECAIDELGIATCLCDPGYEGTNCQTYNPCLLLNCQNGGNCKIDDQGNAFCDCPPQYAGIDCSQDNPCYNQPCQNGGTCQIDENGKAICQCPPGYGGQFCEKCALGYEGNDCQTLIRIKFLGTYNGIAKKPGSPNIEFVCTISENADKVYRMNVANLFNLSSTVYAVVTGSQEWAIPLQTDANGNAIYSLSNGKRNVNTGILTLYTRHITTAADTSDYTVTLSPQ